MTSRWETTHVDANLRNQDLSGDIADAGHRQEPGDLGTKGLDGRAHLSVDSIDRLLQCLDLIQAQLQQEAMMGTEVAA